MKKILIPVYLLLLIVPDQIFAGNIRGHIKANNEELSNTVVYLLPKEKMNFTPPKDAAIMDQVNLNFVPHVLPVLVGTKVMFPNSDKIRHSVFSPAKLKKFDLGTYPPGAEKSIICDKPGIIPILCYIHHEMSAYIIVLETQYFSLSDKNGEYSINKIPPGNYRLSFWSEDYEIKSEDISIPENGTVTKNISVDE